MSIIGVDIGTSTTKVIEYENEIIKNKLIIRDGFSKEKLDEFINKNNISVEKLVFTGIGASKIDKDNYSVPTYIVDEFSS